MEIRGQLEGIGSLGANSGDQAWWQAPLPTVPSYWPTKSHFCFTCPFGSGNYTYTPGMAALSLLGYQQEREPALPSAGAQSESWRSEVVPQPTPSFRVPFSLQPDILHRERSRAAGAWPRLQPQQAVLPRQLRRWLQGEVLGHTECHRAREDPGGALPLVQKLICMPL